MPSQTTMPMRPARWPAIAALLLLALAAPALAQTPVSGTVTGEMRFGDQVIPLTHVYVMEPFVLPDAPPDPEVGRRLIVILADRPHPGDLPPMSIDHTPHRIHEPFNGMHLEIDRNTGVVLYANPIYADNELMAEVTYPPDDSFQTKYYFVSPANSRVSAGLDYVHVGSMHEFEFGAEIAVLRGTRNERLEAVPIQIPGYAKRTLSFYADFDAAILPTPRFLKTLIGHNARGSEIAMAYESHLLDEREVRIAKLDQSLTNSGLDEATIAAKRQRIIDQFPDGADIARNMTRLQEIDLYEDRAILQFASSSFQQSVYSVTDSAHKLKRLTLLRSGDSTFQQSFFGVLGTNRPIANITITRTLNQETRYKPWALHGDSILPVKGYEAAAGIVMILDDGQWHLARR